MYFDELVSNELVCFTLQRNMKIDMNKKKLIINSIKDITVDNLTQALEKYFLDARSTIS